MQHVLQKQYRPTRLEGVTLAQRPRRKFKLRRSRLLTSSLSNKNTLTILDIYEARENTSDTIIRRLRVIVHHGVCHPIEPILGRVTRGEP